MILWCAYCQKFLAETPPFENLEMTHGLCEACTADGSFESPRRSVRDVAAFFSDLVARTQDGAPPAADEIIETGRALGIRESDLLLGVLQPALYEIGRRFEAGELSWAYEHRLTDRVEEVLQRFEAERPERDPHIPRVLLGTASSNQHRVGPTIFSYLLYEAGVVGEFLEAVDPDAYLDALGRHDHAIVGVSVALPEQLEDARRIASVVKQRRPEKPVWLGGYLTKNAAVQSLGSGEFDRVTDPTTTRSTVAELQAQLREADG